MTGRVLHLRLDRGWEEGPGVSAFGLSLLLHGVVLAVILVLSRSGAASRPLSATVRIAGALPPPATLPPPAEEGPAATLAEPEPEPRPVEPEPEPAPEAPVVRPAAPPDPVPIAPPVEPPASEPQPVVEPEPEPPSEPVRPRPAHGEPEPSDPEANPVAAERTVRGRGAAARFEGTVVPHDAYLGGVVRGVSGSWLKPRSVRPPVSAVVYFEIGREGDVSRVVLEQSSGVALYDRAALRAVRLAAPLPPLPPAYRSPSLKVHFEFIP